VLGENGGYVGCEFYFGLIHNILKSRSQKRCRC
jgi:hypothetical protein